MANSIRVGVKKNLLKQLVVTDFKLRYQNSVLGYVWSLLKPLMMFGVLYVVFTYVIPTGKDVPHFPAFLLLGIVVWTFFVESTTMGLGSIVGRADLIKKVQISKISIVFSSILSACVNFCLNLVVLAIFMILSGAEVDWSRLIFVPFLIVELVALGFGLSLFLSSLYVKFRDFGPIWDIVLQTMFYATPIIYPLTFVINTGGERIAQLLSLNPLAQIIQDLRSILITPVTTTTHELLPFWLSYLLPVAIIALLVGLGWLYFKKRSKCFVEDL